MTALFRIIEVGEHADPDLVEEATGADFYHAYDLAESLFEQMDISFSSAEELSFGAIDPSGQFVGAATYGNYNDPDQGLTHTFSIVVAPHWRRRGVARALVHAIVARASEISVAAGVAPYYMVWVVNPHMAALLESEGFDFESGEWSPDAPHMYRYYS